MTKLHETPVLGEVPGGGHVLISNPSGIDPQKFTFARVPVDVASTATWTFRTRCWTT
jgi:hypothetical protein